LSLIFDALDLRDEPGIDAAGRRELSDGGAGPQRLVQCPDPAVVRATSVSRLPGGSRQLSGAPGCSSERSAFCSASAKQRPIAIASPTDFMCVVRTGSAPGNFSNANLGTLTTT
jgi:hypothetical protein